ncbi:MAG: flagellar basal body-associated FliL family protein [Cypionkella sp.]
MRKIIPILLGLIGLLIGSASGYYLRPGAEISTHETSAMAEVPDPEHEPEYAELSNQFIVPVMQKGSVTAMVILSLSLQVTKGSSPDVYNAEPKLRDAFLQVMFDHANSGGFNGAYTDGSNMVPLRDALLEAAKSILGEKVSDVLITDIVRQDS